jgi:hypothetical protein
VAATVGAALAVLAVSGAAAQAANVQNTSVPISFSAPVPCANGGAGEVVDFAGFIHDVVAITTNNNTTTYTAEENFQGLKGIGETTGIGYVGTGATHTTQNGQFITGPLAEGVTLHESFNGQGPATNFTTSELIHFTLNANGTLTATVITVKVSC